jgi:hypothetical protein
LGWRSTWPKTYQNIVVHILPIPKHYDMSSFGHVLTAKFEPEQANVMQKRVFLRLFVIFENDEVIFFTELVVEIPYILKLPVC